MLYIQVDVFQNNIIYMFLNNIIRIHTINFPKCLYVKIDKVIWLYHLQLNN